MDKLNVNQQQPEESKKPEKEELLFDFTSSFKQSTKAGKSFKKKAAASKKEPKEPKEPKWVTAVKEVNGTGKEN